jgi:hypothetical protein
LLLILPRDKRRPTGKESGIAKSTRTNHMQPFNGQL